MRITGGKAKGIRIKTPKGLQTRPTSDKVREALFSTLGPAIQEKVVLDLFAGCGTLGIEALSRGAKSATFVESHANASRFIVDNLEKTELLSQARILRADFRSAVKRLEKEGRWFDMVFLDPPYEENLLHETGTTLATHRIVVSTAIIVVEHFFKEVPPAAISGIPLHETRTYGQTALSYFLAPSE